MILVFECWVLSQLFHSSVSLSSRGSLVLCFLPLKWNHLPIWSCYFSQLVIFIPACELSSPAFCIMCSAFKLNKHDDNKQPFSILNQLVVPYRVLTVSSWPSYRFLRRQVRWSGIPISLKSFPQFVVIHTVKGFSVVSKTEVDVFLEFSCFLYDPANVDSFISGSCAFSKPSLNIWKFSVHIMLKPSLEDFEHNLISIGNKCNCPMVWTFFSTALLGNWDEDWPFSVMWPLLSFPNLLTYWVQHFNSIRYVISVWMIFAKAWGIGILIVWYPGV